MTSRAESGGAYGAALRCCLLMAACLLPSPGRALEPDDLVRLNRAEHWQDTLQQTLTASLAAAAEARRAQAAPVTMKDWHRVGPFQLPVETADDAVIGPQQTLATGVDLNASYGEDLSWRRTGISLQNANYLRPRAGGVEFYVCTVTAAADSRLQVRIGSNCRLVAWLDGEQILMRPTPERFSMTGDAVDVPVSAGDHQLLLRISSHESRPAFRIKQETMEAIPDDDAVLAAALDVVFTTYREHPERGQIDQERLLGLLKGRHALSPRARADRYQAALDSLAHWLPVANDDARRRVAAFPRLLDQALAAEPPDFGPVYKEFHELNSLAKNNLWRQLGSSRLVARRGTLEIDAPANATVEVSVERRALNLGAGLPAGWFTGNRDYLPSSPTLDPAEMRELQTVIRSQYNSVYLKGTHRFSHTQHAPGQVIDDSAQIARRWSDDANLTVRFEPLMGGLTQHPPAWLVSLSAGQRQDVALDRLRTLIPRMARPGETIDLYYFDSDGRDIASLYSSDALAAQFALAHELTPGSPVGVVLRDALTSEAALDTHIKRLQSLQKAGAQIDELAVTLETDGRLNPYTISDRLSQLSEQVARISIVELAVNEPDEVRRASLIIATYHLLEAQSMVVGIYDQHPIAPRQNDEAIALWGAAPKFHRLHPARSREHLYSNRAWHAYQQKTADSDSGVLRTWNAPLGWLRVTCGDQVRYLQLSRDTPFAELSFP